MNDAKPGHSVLVVILLALSLTAGAQEKPSITTFSKSTAGDPLPKPWQALLFKDIPRHTEYSLVHDAEAGTVVRAKAESSASGLMHPVNIDAKRFPILLWRWKAENLLPRSDVTKKEGDDYPARIYVSFAYDPQRVSVLTRVKYETAKLLYGNYPPHAGLNYIWESKSPVGTMAPNPFSDRVMMFVVESGAVKLKQWITYERNVFEDYKRAFGEEPPPISGVAIMTDADNTRDVATAYYGDIEFLSAPR